MLTQARSKLFEKHLSNTERLGALTFFVCLFVFLTLLIIFHGFYMASAIVILTMVTLLWICTLKAYLTDTMESILLFLILIIPCTSIWYGLQRRFGFAGVQK